MNWDQLAWTPVDGGTLPAAASLATIADILRSAVDEAVSAAVLAPVTLAGITFVAAGSVAELGDGAEPLATFELMGAGRRQVRVGIVPATGGSLAGAAVEPVVLGRAIIDGLDGVFSDLLGDGLGIGPADAADIEPSSRVIAVRLALRDQANAGVDLIAVTAESVPAELAAHVMALQALAGSDAEAPPLEAGAAAGVAGQGAVDDVFAALQAEAAQVAHAAVTPAVTPAATPAAPIPAARPSAPAPAAAIRTSAFPELLPQEPERSSSNLDLLLGVNLQVTVEIGRSRLPIRDVLALAPGSIVELDKLAGEAVDVLVNGRHVASGEVVVVDENFGVRITEIVSRTKRVQAGAAPAA